MISLRKASLGAALVSSLTLLSAPASAGWFDWLIPSEPVEEEVEVEESTPDYSDGLRPAIFVGNNWDGTVDVIDGDNYEILGRINAIPDYQERMEEIKDDFWRYTIFLGIRQLIGEGNDQFVDDMYSTNDGELLIASRPSFGDVVALDLETGAVVWRFEVDGVRSDHMALSPDGMEVAVSASTGSVVHLLNVYTGEEVGRFPTEIGRASCRERV